MSTTIDVDGYPHQVTESDPAPGGVTREQTRVLTLLRRLRSIDVEPPAALTVAETAHRTLTDALAQVREDGAMTGGGMHGSGEFALVLHARRQGARELREAAISGRLPDVDGVRDRVAAARARALAAQDCITVLTDALTAPDGTEASGGLMEALRGCADEIWPALHDRLQDLLAEVQDERQHLPAGPVTAEAAMDAGPKAQKAYTRLRDELLPTHTALRALQVELATTLAGGAWHLDPVVRTEVARLRDVDTVWPSALGPTHVPIDDGMLTDQAVEVPAPWPADQLGRLLWEAASGRAWVPTPEQFTAAHQKALDARYDRQERANQQRRLTGQTV